MGFYFNRIYNPVYDFIVAQNTPYHRLQQACIERLELADGDRLLCAGVGTGNEILRILETHPNVRITGVDLSATALKKAQRKASQKGKSIETRLMDVQKLDFPPGSFDKTLCVHVTDFVPDSARASAEMLRVLRQGGRFAITFPSGKEDIAFGMSVIGEAVREHWRNRRFHKILLVFLAAGLGTFVYLPFIFRKARREYARKDVDTIFSPLTGGSHSVDEFPVYNDYIVSGGKQEH